MHSFLSPLFSLLLLLPVTNASAHGDSTFVDSVLAMPYNDLVRDLPASQRVLQRALAEARAAGDKQAMGSLHRWQSTVTGLAGQLDSAAYHGLAAVALFQEIGDRRMVGVMLCDLGHGLKRRDLPRAFDHFREGIAILESLGAEMELTRAYNNYAPLHEMNGEVDSALYFARKGLALKEALNDSTGLPYGLNRVASLLLHKQRFEEANALMLRADSIRRITNDVHGLADQVVYFGDLYKSWGRTREAIAHFEEGVLQARAAELPYLEQYCQERLAECHEGEGDARAALHATRRAFAIKDSLLNERNSRTIIELEQRFAGAEKDRAIAELGAAAAQRRAQLWLILAIMVVLVVSALLWYQVKQRRLRAERDAAIIQERDAGLKAVFDATESERRRLAAELHDGVGQQLGGLKHRLESLKAELPQAGAASPLSDVIHIVDDTSREVRDLAHRMMPRALARLGLAPALEDMLKRSFHGTGVQHSFEHFAVDEHLRPELATGLYRIAQELVGNILKHAQARKVDVQLLRNKDHVILLVQDDGRGFKAGNGSGHVGIGLRNIRDRTRSLGGMFTLEGTPDQGTEATVRVPLHLPITA